MLILGIETATTNCSVALFDDNGLIDVNEHDGGYTHAENLHVFINDLLKRNEREYSQLTAIAVGAGPGSYTGLRIGVSAAKGLCFALNIPLISIDTLQTMVKGLMANRTELNISKALLCPMIDARRMEVYTSLIDGSFNTVLKTQPLIVDDNCLLKKFSDYQSIFYFGSGAQKCESILQNFSNCEFVDLDFNPASSKYMADLVQEKMKRKEIEDIAYYEPNYLKEFRATTPKKLI